MDSSNSTEARNGQNNIRMSKQNYSTIFGASIKNKDIIIEGKKINSACTFYAINKIYYMYCSQYFQTARRKKKFQFH